jgi:alpha-amylase
VQELAKRLATALAALSAASARADVIMEGFYWNVPSPAAGNTGSDWWWDHIAEQAHTIRLAGIGTMWLPPALKGASGGYSVGYDPFDDYDLGDKKQMGLVPTRYGSRLQLERCCAMLHANGINVMEDIVDQHRDGDNGNYSFNYATYNSSTGGRFAKSYYDFIPNVPQDPDVWDAGNLENFGRDLAPINGEKHWIYNGLISALAWQTAALDLDSYRFDYVKGISADWLKPLMTTAPMAGKFAVGEFDDGSVSNCEDWIKASNYMNDTMSVFDYPLHYVLAAMCNSPNTFNMASLDHAGLQGVDPFRAVTFVENHDTDQGSPIVQNKLLAYAYVLTSEGYPCVFYRDWSKDPGCYGSGMQSGINDLIWIHEFLASGTTIQRWENNLVFVYERQGGKHLLVGLNNNIGYDYKLYNVQTGFGANVRLHDYTGHCPDVTTNASGKVNLDLPPAINGQGYCAYAPAGLTGSFTAPQNATTQEYDGAVDLDLPAADNTKLVEVCQTYVQAHSPITAKLTWDQTGWTSQTRIYLELVGPNGDTIASMSCKSSTPQGATFRVTPIVSAFCTWKIRSYNTPSSNPEPAYALTVTYTAPQTPTSTFVP